LSGSSVWFDGFRGKLDGFLLVCEVSTGRSLV